MASTAIPSSVSLDPADGSGIQGLTLTLGRGGIGNLNTTPQSIDPLSNITQVNGPDLSNLSSAVPDLNLGAPATGTATAAGGGAAGGGMNFGMIGSGIGDLFAAGGDQDEAKDYTNAANIATQNAAISVESTDIQKTQAQRDIYQTIGSQQAEVASSGTTGGGSAQALLRSSRQQGALQQQQISVQGQINENSYKEQAQAYTGEADAAKAAASASTAGGIGSILGGLF